MKTKPDPSIADLHAAIFALQGHLNEALERAEQAEQSLRLACQEFECCTCMDVDNKENPK